MNLFIYCVFYKEAKLKQCNIEKETTNKQKHICVYTYLPNVLLYTHSVKWDLCRHLHVYLRVNIHGDNWLEPCKADGIVMTSGRTTHTHTHVSLAQVSHGMAHGLCFRTDQPTCQERATGQSHFQQINLI